MLKKVEQECVNKDKGKLIFYNAKLTLRTTNFEAESGNIFSLGRYYFL